MRLIDADALKEDLTRFYDGEVTARNLIDEQPTVDGWISVEDRLPNDAGKYLVTIKSNFTDTKYIVKTAWFLNDLYDNCQFRYEGISEHSPGFYNGDGEGDWIENVAYWMPLPEPPKEGEMG